MFGIARRYSRSAIQCAGRHRKIDGSSLVRPGILDKKMVAAYAQRGYFHDGYEAAAARRILEAAVGSVDTREKNPSLEHLAGRSERLILKKLPLEKEIVSPPLSTTPVSYKTSKSSGQNISFPPTRISSSLGPILRTSWQYSGMHTTSSLSSECSLVLSRRSFSTGAGGPDKSKYKTSVKIPEPKSAPNHSMFSFASFDPKALMTKVLEISWSFTKIILTFLVKLPMNTFYYLTHPQERRDKIQEIKDHAKKEFDHYWTGTKVRLLSAI